MNEKKVSIDALFDMAYAAWLAYNDAVTELQATSDPNVSLFSEASRWEGAYYSLYELIVKSGLGYDYADWMLDNHAGGAGDVENA